MIKEVFKKYIYKITAPNYQQVKDNISELVWANIYHDTTRGMNWVQNLPISPTGMAINYSMLYLLTRVLTELKPLKILEFGLGQSTKFINAFSLYENQLIKHDVIEHDNEWINAFKFNKSSNCKVYNLILKSINLNNNKIQVYENLMENIDKNYDLYFVDGPVGLPIYSRYDMCLVAENFREDVEFIIIMDDYKRSGEKEIIDKLLSILL